MAQRSIFRYLPHAHWHTQRLTWRWGCQKINRCVNHTRDLLTWLWFISDQMLPCNMMMAKYLIVYKTGSVFHFKHIPLYASFYKGEVSSYKQKPLAFLSGMKEYFSQAISSYLNRNRKIIDNFFSLKFPPMWMRGLFCSLEHRTCFKCFWTYWTPFDFHQMNSWNILWNILKFHEMKFLEQMMVEFSFLCEPLLF